MTTAVAAKDKKEAAVDALFADFDKPRSPGMAVGIYHNGRVVYTNAYGLADLEHNIKVTPSTHFLTGSVAKQFTAFAAALLVREGKIDLSADIRTYLPYLPDFGQKITVADLIHHTNGLRDQVALFDLAGLNDALQHQWMFDAMMARQRDLNAAPGTRFEYVNTGYTLLGEIVSKASGKSLRTFTDERMFKPLGMTHTFFHDDVGEIIPDLARSYDKDTPDGPWKNQVVPYDGHVGATNHFSTIGDMMIWAQNYLHPKVGDKALMDQLFTVGKLKDGTPIHYAYGLEWGNFGGHKSIYHTGSDTGFRAIVALFPQDDFAVVILSNIPVDRKSRVAAIADLYLNGGTGKMTTPAAPAVAQLDPRKVEELAGSYAHDVERTVTLALVNGKLEWQERDKETKPVVFRADGTFDLGDDERPAAFYTPIRDNAGKVVAFQKTNDDNIKTRFQRFAPPAAPMPLDPLTGDYFSNELDTKYTLSVEQGKLTARTLWRQEPTAFDQVATDRFESVTGPITALTIQRDTKGRPTAFLLSVEDVSNLKFERMDKPHK